jgi:prolyl 4-hydroxylase
LRKPILALLILVSSIIPLSTLKVFNTSSIITHLNAVKESGFLSVSLKSMVCNAKAQYTTEILSLDPLMIHIKDFVSSSEASHLVKLSNFTGRVFVSKKLEDNGSPLSGVLPLTDTIVQCVLARAGSFLGPGPIDHIDFEAPWIAKYAATGQRIQMHFDPPTQVQIDTQNRKYNWLTSFFVYLDSEDCDGGETYFPQVSPLPRRGNLDRESPFTTGPEGKGLAVKPRKGNAIFWQNLSANGTRLPGSIHAGLPIRHGSKIGMNIWARQYRWEGEYGDTGRAAS